MKYIIFILIIFCYACTSTHEEKKENSKPEQNSFIQDVDSAKNFMLWGAPATELHREEEFYLHSFVTTDTSGAPPVGDPPNYYYWYNCGHFWPSNGSNDSIYQIGQTRIGNFYIAKNISVPDTPYNSAGLVYGKEGVCHQIANRTVYPTYWTGTGSPERVPLSLSTNTNYPGKDSYIATLILFGVYGTNSTPDKPRNYDFKQRILAAGGDTSWVGHVRNDDEIMQDLLMNTMKENYSPQIFDTYLNAKIKARIFMENVGQEFSAGKLNYVEMGEKINKKINEIIQTDLKPLVNIGVFQSDSSSEVIAVDIEICKRLDEVNLN